MSKTPEERECVAPTYRRVTCREAVELCKRPGARVFWRPDGVVNWMLPELDVAEVALEV